MWLIFLFVCVALLVLYLYITKQYNYWKARGVDTPNYHYVGGNFYEQFTFKKNAGLIVKDDYTAFQGYNYFGYYNSTRPMIVMRNPDIISDLLIKDFTSFADNDLDIDEDADLIFGKHPFILKGQRWKEVRAQQTPSFSSGKIKIMLPLINETNAKILNYMERHKGAPVNLDDVTKRITAENVASCAFGLEGGSFTNEKAQFLEIANEPMTPSTQNIVKGLLIYFFPVLARYVKINYFRKETVEYLGDIVRSTMQYRQDNNIRRNDFLDEMKHLNDKIHDKNVFNFSHILAHAGGFLMDGIITSAITASHMLYELARNQDVQQKLREEIENVLQDQELTYEKMKEMKYLECVFKEGLRLHPPVFTMTKRVTKPYTMPPMREDNTGPSVELEVGTGVIIPLYALHMDDKYFPQPERFDPERWREDNKDNVYRNAYIPFSDGPRACLGMRFGILQTKATLITFVRNYQLNVSNKTQEPIKIEPTSLLNTPAGGYWLDINNL